MQREMLMTCVDRLYPTISAQDLSSGAFITHVSTTELIGELRKFSNVEAKAPKQKRSVLSKQSLDLITIKRTKAEGVSRGPCNNRAVILFWKLNVQASTVRAIK